jgi:hypothetical protein
VSIIKVTAGGSVVHETHFPGQPEEMVSVWRDERLPLTHLSVHPGFVALPS